MYLYNIKQINKNTENMKNSEVHNVINLRAMMIDAETIRLHKRYGKDSATAKSKFAKERIGMFVSYVLKPVLLANR